MTKKVTKKAAKKIVKKKDEVKKDVKENAVETVVTKDKEIRVYGLIEKTYTIGEYKIRVHKNKYLKIPLEVLPLLEGLQVVKKI